VKSAKGNYAQSKAISELQSVTDKLQRNSGNDPGVERQRGEVLGKLSEINNELSASQAPQEPAGQVITGNSFLYEQDLGQNRDNYFNSILFFENNGRFQSGSGGGQQGSRSGGQQGSTDVEFRFGITIQDLEESDQTKSLKEAGQKSGEEKSGGEKADAEKPQASPQPALIDAKREMAEESRSGRDGVAIERKSGRSQLMQRRAGQAEPGKPLALQDQTMSLNALDESETMEQAMPQQMDDALSLNIRQTATIEGRQATPTGLLSLRFDIPTDGQQIDFLRVGGNPALSLDVRSSDSVTMGTGLIWLVLCVIGILLLIGPGRHGKSLIFCQRLFLILALAGLAGWILTTGDLRAFGLMACIGGAIGLAATTVIARLRNQTR